MTSQQDILGSPKLTILLVDDEGAQLMLLRMLLERQGYQVVTAVDGEKAMELFRKNPDIRLVITDITMPVMDGYDLIRNIRIEQNKYVYIIVLTSNEEKKSVVKALNYGADDFLTKPALNEELQLRIQSGIRLLRLEGHDALILSMAKLAEYRSEETGYHLERVQRYVWLLAEDMSGNCPNFQITMAFAEEISQVTPLHDIGKVATPDHILHKPGKLTEGEFETMKEHAAIGGKMLLDIYSETGSHYLKTASDVAMFHHEKYDGTGYPEGLKGDAIPTSARVMALADIYDAMSSERCYKDAFPHEKVKTIILEERGKQLDPDVVDSFLRQEDVWLAIKARFK